MKKIFSIILICVLSFSLVACGSKENTPSQPASNGSANSGKNDDSDSSGKKDDNSSNNSNNNNSGNNSSDSDSGKKDDVKSDGNDRAAMEQKIASYLSKIGGPDTISICDGSKISYEPWSEWSMYGDQWTISGANITADELKASLDKQLVEGCGFQDDVSLFGRTYFKRAGSKQIGLIVNADSDSSGTVITVWMTHAPENYSQDYIKAQEESMPKIIPGDNALDVLPENYDIEVDHGYMKIRYARKDGNYFYAYEYPKTDTEDGWSSAVVYIKNSEGYEKYTSSSSSGGGYAEGAKFRSEGTITEDQLKKLLADWYDFEGTKDSGNLSTWLQMSKDFRDGVSFLGANSRFSITESVQKTGTENIAGIECDVAKSSGMWTQNSFAYDPATGIMFKIVKTENNEDEVIMQVTKYDTNPAKLGNYNG